MAVRTGMANLITRLRAMTNTAAADYTLGAKTYWADQDLQDVLDLYRTDLEHVSLTAAPEYVSGSSVYYDYYAPMGDLEESGSGVEAWAVRDSSGVLVAVEDYTPNYLNGHLRFDTDQAGTSFTLRARSYLLNAAAAHIWRQKAAHVAERFAISTDNHTLNRNQLIEHYLKMAAQYDRQSGIRVSKLERSDLL